MSGNAVARQQEHKVGYERTPSGDFRSGTALTRAANHDGRYCSGVVLMYERKLKRISCPRAFAGLDLNGMKYKN